MSEPAKLRRPVSRRLGDLLVADGLITPEQLQKALQEQKNTDEKLGSILVRLGMLNEDQYIGFLSRQYGIPSITLSQLDVDPELCKLIPAPVAKKYEVLPVKRVGNTLTLAMSDPTNVFALDDVAFLTNLQVMPVVASQVAIRKAIDRSYEKGAGAISEILGDLRAEAVIEGLEEAAGPEAVDENDSVVVRLANQVIIDAYKARASDIHIEPYGPNEEMVIRYRVDGSCQEYQRIPATYRRALVARLKIMSMLDIAERRKPQDGKIKFRLPDRQIELRVATVPTAGGNEDIVMRILAASEPIPVDKLGMTERNLREIKAAAEKPYGLILCVGPTGSGKTTTLHSVLGYINKPERKIWTAEDPVEITQRGLRQVQVQPKIGFTFAIAMRAFLRADPDVIMVGEMRDAETASTGIEASLTGHLVFSTLHTNSAPETVIRLLDMGMDPFNFADALLGVLAQRLVKRICSDCKEKYHPPKSEYDELARAYGEEALERLAKYDDAFVLYRGKGCQSCNKSGYRGRAGIHELLAATEEIKRLIQRKASVAELLVAAKQGGMTTLVQDGIMKSLSGVTDFRQVKAVAIK